MQTRFRAKIAGTENGEDNAADIAEPTANGPEEHGVEIHLSKALQGLRTMQRELVDLRRGNGELEGRLEAFEQAADASIQPKRGKRGGPNPAKLQADIRRLNRQIQVLEKAKRKDRKTIAKLRAREVKEDVAELEDDAEVFVGDSPHRMRKLLRCFHDIVLSTSIEETEECPICMDTLVVNRCVSLPCEHTFCKSCISQISPGEEGVTCPQCRAVCLRDEIEVIQYTAAQQWDDLLDVAKAWAKTDLRRQPDTSEEEREEEFIHDSSPGRETSSIHSVSENSIATSPEPEGVRKELPPPKTPQPPLEEPPVTSSSRKRRIAFSPESSPLSNLGSEEAEVPGPSTSALDIDLHDSEPSTLPLLDQESPVAGPSIHADDTDATPNNSQNKPKYAESPARDKRKRMEDLATARKQKRRL